jgi:hypothetical protein
MNFICNWKRDIKVIIFKRFLAQYHKLNFFLLNPYLTLSPYVELLINLFTT